MRHWLSGQRMLDNDLNIDAGAKLFAYVEGTSTPLDTYSDADFGTPNTFPVVADGSGLFPNIFLLPRGYKLVLKNADESVTYWTLDNQRPPEVYRHTSAPAEPAAGQLWVDTAGGVTSNILKYYDGGDWISIGTFNETANTFNIPVPAGTAAVPSISTSTDPDTGFYSYAANQIGVALGGVLKYIFGAAFTLVDGLLVMTNAAGNLIRTATADGADNQRIVIAGGGDASISRGGLIQVSGNEAPSDGGNVTIKAGTVGSSRVDLMTGGDDVGLRVADDGAGNPTVVLCGGTPVFRLLSAAVTWDIPSTLSNAAADTNVSVPGAKPGDIVFAAIVDNVGTFTLFANVSSAGNVFVRARNNTGSTSDPASATLRVLVLGFVA